MPSGIFWKKKKQYLVYIEKNRIYNVFLLDLQQLQVLVEHLVKYLIHNSGSLIYEPVIQTKSQLPGPQRKRINREHLAKERPSWEVCVLGGDAVVSLGTFEGHQLLAERGNEVILVDFFQWPILKSLTGSSKPIMLIKH